MARRMHGLHDMDSNNDVRTWLGVALRGALALALGALVFFFPKESLASLVVGLGAYAIVEGILALWVSAFAPARSQALVLRGVVGVCVGLFALLGLGLELAKLVTILGAGAVVTGALEVWVARRMRGTLAAMSFWSLAGAGTVLFGLILLGAPAFAVPFLVFLVAGYGLVFGGTMIAWAVRLRTLERRARLAAA
jgi:uncharacterized membrane protein HdeD (DUF308 family)